MRAQASFEAIVAVVFLLFFLVVVLFNLFTMSSQADTLADTDLKRLECAKVDSAITGVMSVSENSSVDLELVNDFNISGDFINFGSYYCYHKGLWTQKSVSKGNVRVSRQGGVLDVSNF